MNERKELPEAWAEFKLALAKALEREIGWMERFLYWLSGTRFVQWFARSRPFRWLP